MFFILGWDFQAMQLCKHLKPRPEEHLPSNQPQHQQISPTAIQTCGGKEGGVTVKMTPFGCPPSHNCWDSGPLSTLSTASPAVPAHFFSMIVSQDIC